MINAKVPAERFAPFLTRIASSLGVASAPPNPFSAEEQAQLASMFSATPAELELVMALSSYVFEQAAFTATAPEALYTLLLDEAGLDEAHAKALGRVWAQEAAGLVARLKQRTLGAPALVDVDYHLNLIMGESSLTRLQEPTALFEFTVAAATSAAPESAGGEKSSGNKKIGVEFSHPELYSFFSQLERIQSQLDNLS